MSKPKMDFFTEIPEIGLKIERIEPKKPLRWPIIC